MRFEQGGRFLIVVLRKLSEFRIDFGQIVKLELGLIQPISIRFFSGQVRFQIAVFDDPALFKVDQQHLAWLKAPFAGDVFFRKGQHAAFRSEANDVVFGHAEACGAQTVAIQCRADLATIGETHSRRAIPRLHQSRVVFVKCSSPFIHESVPTPRFRHQDHHRMGERVTARQQQLQGVVETGRVRLPVRDNWPHLVEIRPQQLAFHRAATRVHPVHIAANRVDLAVMRDQTKRMGQTPAGKGVGREALVHEAERRNAIGIAQIVEEAVDLIAQEQALVDDRAAGKARQIQVGQAGQIVLLSQLAKRVLHLLADDEELALKSVLIRAIVAARDDRLLDNRHRIDHRFAEAVQGSGNIAPANQALALFFNERFKALRDEAARRLVLRHEAHRHAVIARLGQIEAVFLGPFAQQGIGNLQQNSGAVAQKGIRANRAAVVDTFKDFKRLAHNCVALFALDMSDHTYAAGVVFVSRVVKTLGDRLSHGANPSC